MLDKDTRGVDSDLESCVGCNPQSFNTDDIVKVHAVYEGENDGPAWHWVLELTSGIMVHLEGGCDYTGWDCQSYARSKYLSDPLNDIAAWTEDEDVRDILLKQLKEQQKLLTWDERTTRQFEVENQLRQRLDDAHEALSQYVSAESRLTELLYNYDIATADFAPWRLTWAIKGDPQKTVLRDKIIAAEREVWQCSQHLFNLLRNIKEN